MTERQEEAAFSGAASLRALLKREKLSLQDQEVLTEHYKSVALLEDPGSRALAREISARIRALSPEERGLDTTPVEIDVPFAVDGSAFEWNGRKVSGQTILLPRHQAQGLLSLIDQNRRVDMARIRDNGRVDVKLGELRGEMSAMANTIRGGQW